MRAARFFMLSSACLLGIFMAAHCISKARAELNFTEDGGYAEIYASLHLNEASQ